MTMTAELGPDGQWSGTLDGALRGVDLSELASVWWRKPTTFRFADGMSGPEQGFAASQAKRAFAGVLGSLPGVLWVNRPERNADCTKPAQLAAAAGARLPVPATLITNSPGAVREFAGRCGGRVVTKVLGGIVHTENGQRGQSDRRSPPEGHHVTDTAEPTAESLRHAMVDALTADGSLTDPGWQRAFRDVPRHLFVPYFYRQGADGSQQRVGGDDPGHAAEWLKAVYANRALVTHLIDGNAASSSSQPSLMAVMLEALGERADVRVKEIGTGAGYNAALLSHRYGDDQVVTVDVDQDITETARRRLGRAGYRPTVITGDGAAAHLPAEPGRSQPRRYGAIIATCGLARIPLAWLPELAPGGVIVAPVGYGIARLHRTGEAEAGGRFLTTPAYFMPLRAAGDSGVVRRPQLSDGDRRPSAIGADALVDEDFRFLVSIAMPPLGWQYDLGDDGTPAGARVWTSDGSIAELRPDGTVTEAGPRPLWSELESAHRAYRAHDRPARDRYGITVTGTGQRVWLDSPDGPSWTVGSR
ncbi:methyltransferase domain-containing protein [Kitasatospora sp. NPDC096204]|uniref:methyltransferase domain-containing protein n=1 Tax=Kitasatospora sp. NPDC096204 TaxID=3364094 RepID=UPI003807F66C